MYNHEDLGVTINEQVALVEIQRPPYNFFDFKLIEQLAETFEALDDNSDCRAIVLAADGKAFCAGANFGGGERNKEANEEFTQHGFNNTTANLYRAAVRMFSCKKPIIGAIQGAAIGGGLGLSLVPDFRIASSAARFAANFVKLGIHPGFGISVTLPRLIGQQRAMDMLLTGRRVKAEEALAIGLVDKLVEADQLRDAAHQYARSIAENAPLAVVSVRNTQRAGLADSIAEMTEIELKEQQWLRGTADADEGILAVSARRPGNFSGS